MAEPDGSQQAPGRSRRRRDYARDGKIAMMIRLLEEEAPLEPRRGRRPVVAGVVIAVVIAVVVAVLVFAMLGFLGR